MAGGMNDTQRMILSVILSALAGVGLYFVTQLHEGVVLGVTVAVFIILLLALPKQKKPEEVMVAPGVSLALHRQVKAEGQLKLSRVEKALLKIPGDDPALILVENIQGTLQSIYAHFDHDPEDIPPAAAFRDHHVGKAVTLIEDYSKLIGDPLLDEGGRDYVLRARDRFAGIEAAFIAQYNALLRHDISALEKAGRNLETSLRLEHGLETISGKGRDKTGRRENME